MSISLKVKHLKDRYPEVLEVSLFIGKGVQRGTSITKSESSLHTGGTESYTSTGDSMDSSLEDSRDDSEDLRQEDSGKGSSIPQIKISKV